MSTQLKKKGRANDLVSKFYTQVHRFPPNLQHLTKTLHHPGWRDGYYNVYIYPEGIRQSKLTIMQVRNLDNILLYLSLKDYTVQIFKCESMEFGQYLFQ